ncbi:MAG: lytic murein transglycosylase [Microthrixaceae bacterium]
MAIVNAVSNCSTLRMGLGPRTCSTVWIASVVLLILSLCPGTFVAAQSGEPISAGVANTDQYSDPVPGQGLAAAVAAVPASSSTLNVAMAERKRLSDSQQQVRQELQQTEERIQADTLNREAAQQSLDEIGQQVALATEQQQKLRVALRIIGVEWFVTGFGKLSALNPALSSTERERLDRARVLSESAAETTISKERIARMKLRDLERNRSELQVQVTSLESSLGELTQLVQGLQNSEGQLTEQIAANELQVGEARMSATIDGTDLSTGALDAYWRAAAALAVSNPNCAIPWWAIAGVGRTESKHGTYRGASLGRDGVVTPPIFGPELNGSNSFAIVRDSDGGALDGTSATDRAVGPMQFLPSSWKAVARDGTGDGVADPQNLYDAALTAGVYLCRKGPGLNQDGPLRGAYFSYNRSQEYVRIVLEQARGYQRAVPQL